MRGLQIAPYTYLDPRYCLDAALGRRLFVYAPAWAACSRNSLFIKACRARMVFLIFAFVRRRAFATVPSPAFWPGSAPCVSAV